jgi:transposase
MSRPTDIRWPARPEGGRGNLMANMLRTMARKMLRDGGAVVSTPNPWRARRVKRLPDAVIRARKATPKPGPVERRRLARLEGEEAGR